MKAHESKEEGTSTFLTFPNDVLTGCCGRFADAYSAISESPRHFYGMAYLTCLGNYLSGKATLSTLLDVQPRMYVIFIGPSGRGRKSTALNVTTGFFRDVFEDFNLMHQANSGEGLNVFLEKHPQTILVYDEFLNFVNKAIQRGNTILGAVTSLFEKNAYQTATKDKQLVIENAHVSMLGACTTDTWERCWERDFTAIGLNNRLFIVPGMMETLISIPPKLDVEIWKSLRDDLRDAVKHATTVKDFTLSTGAYAKYDDWYKTTLDHKSLHSVRLDAYALRLMILFATCDYKYEIDEETVEKAIRLANWEYRVRQEFDPVDAENAMARMEQTMRRTLGQGGKSRKELQQRCNANRAGLWIFKIALDNLMGNGEVRLDPKAKRYFLEEAKNW